MAKSSLDKFVVSLNDKLIQWAKYRSSGFLSYYELALRQHPYGVRNTNVSLQYLRDSSYINAHSMVFKNSWTIKKVASGYKLMNTAPYANKLFEGIPGLTIPRPFFTSPSAQKELDKIERSEVKTLVQNLKHEISDIFKEN